MKIKDAITDELNIYAAYYSLESYLDDKITDAKLIQDFNKYKNRHDFQLVKKLINMVKKRINKVFNEDDFFDVNIRYEIKKVSVDNKLIYRSIHQPKNIVDLIAMVSILNVFIKNINASKEVILTGISKSIPDNFYGSKPSSQFHKLYEPWRNQYSSYTEKYIELIKKYTENKKFDLEINLDIKNFFPSINPKIISSYIEEKFKLDYPIEEIEFAIRKLILMKIDEKTLREDYFIPNINENSTQDILKRLLEDRFTLGIPQGLPQSYFFANIIMVEIARISDDVFGGKAIYYVDDSIRFIKRDSKFSIKDKVSDLNSKIEQFEKKYIDKYNAEIEKDFIPYSNDGIYGIKIHEYLEDNSGKTTYSELKESRDELISFYLSGITKNASVAPWEIQTSREINDKLAVLSRVKALLELVNFKIDQKNNSSILEKKLKRIRKFLMYRIDIYELAYEKLNENFIKLVNEFDELPAKETLDKIENELVLLKYKLFIQYAKENDLKSVQKKMSKLGFFDKFSIPMKFPKKFVFDDYSEVENYIKNSMIRQYKSRIEFPDGYLETIEEIVKIHGEGKFIKTFVETKYSEFVESLYSVSIIFRKVLTNVILSKLFSVKIAKDLNLLKENNKDINMLELKIFIFVRNKHERNTNLLDQMRMLDKKNTFNDLINTKVDYTLLSILPEFVREIRETELIYNLIDTHYYVQSSWSNGSLFFRNYTSHDQNHSIHIMRTANTLLKTIEGLTLNYFEKYLLYMSSYIHDISLAIPSSQGEYLIDGKLNHVGEKIITELADYSYSEAEKESNTDFVHRLMLLYVDFLSEEIRKKHAYLSTQYLEKKNEFRYIDKAHKSIISEISINHTNDNVSNLFNYRETFEFSRPEIDKEKLIKILRISDVLDITNQRVKKIYMDNNLEYMSDYSIFHWASHLITEDVKYEAVTTVNENLMKEHNNLENKYIIETITITVYLNFVNLEKTNHISEYDIYIDEEGSASITFDGSKNRKNFNVPFTLKWFIKKNNYLFSEIFVFQDMLNKMYKFSETIFEIKIKNSNRTIKIDSDIARIVREHVEK